MLEMFAHYLSQLGQLVSAMHGEDDEFDFVSKHSAWL